MDVDYINFSSSCLLLFSIDPIKSFAIDKLSGKKCLMLGARRLLIAWGDTPTYWDWISVPYSRFVCARYISM